jgi:hypothetical protein
MEGQAILTPIDIPSIITRSIICTLCKLLLLLGQRIEESTMDWRCSTNGKARY